jgi:hypothetical protein
MLWPQPFFYHEEVHFDSDRCSSLYVGKQQLGTGAFQNAVQEIVFNNLNTKSAAPVSDGTNYYFVPPGESITGFCIAWDDDVLHMPEAIRKYLPSGSTFTLTTAVASWSARHSHQMVVRLDGVLVLAGGYSGYSDVIMNDFWASPDGGSTWALLTAAASWSARADHQMVVRLDGVLVLAGGFSGVECKNDAWASPDGGSTWALLTAAASWSARAFHRMMVRLDGVLVLAGGYPYTNDAWASPDGGSTWALLTAAASWSARGKHEMVVRLDGVLVLAGGYSDWYIHDVWYVNTKNFELV